MTTQREYRNTLIRLAKRELERATLYAKGSYLQACHIRVAGELVDRARRYTRNMHRAIQG